MIADSLTDVALDDDRQISLGHTGDLDTVSGIDDVEQSVGINAGRVVRPLIGEPLDDTTFARIEARLEEIIADDPQIEGVNSVDITEVNTSAGTVNVRIRSEINNEYEITVTA